MIAYETGVASTADPLAGSYYLETLTDEMERRCLAYFDQIDALGGVEGAIDAGFFAAEIGDASYRQQREFDTAERLTVGVNAFVSEGQQTPLLPFDAEVERQQQRRLETVRRERNPQAAAGALESLRAAAREGRNTMPAFMACAHAYCTLGEQMDVLREVYGSYQEPAVV